MVPSYRNCYPMGRNKNKRKYDENKMNDHLTFILLGDEQYNNLPHYTFIMP